MTPNGLPIILSAKSKTPTVKKPKKALNTNMIYFCEKKFKIA